MTLSGICMFSRPRLIKSSWLTAAKEFELMGGDRTEESFEEDVLVMKSESETGGKFRMR